MLLQDVGGASNHCSAAARIELVEGRVGQGVRLRDEAIHLPRTLLDQRAEYTLTAWVRPARRAGLFRLYGEKAPGPPGGAALTIQQVDIRPDGAIDLHAWNALAAEHWARITTPEGTAAPDAWSFIALRLKKGPPGRCPLTIRVNERTSEHAFQSVDHPSGTGAEIGPADGLIDELAIFGRALSDAEIQRIYRREVGGLHFLP